MFFHVLKEKVLMLHVTTKYECQVSIVYLAAKRLKKVEFSCCNTNSSSLSKQVTLLLLYLEVVMLAVEIDRVCNRQFNDRLSGADTVSFEEYF